MILPDYISLQPKDVIFQIMCELSYPDLMKLCLCSKRLNDLSNNDALWNKKTQKDYRKPLPTAKQRYCYVAKTHGYYFGSKVTRKALKSVIRKDEKEIFKYYIQRCPIISEYIDRSNEDYVEQLEELTDTIVAYMVICCEAWTIDNQKLLDCIFSENIIKPINLIGAMHKAIKSVICNSLNI